MKISHSGWLASALTVICLSGCGGSNLESSLNTNSAQTNSQTFLIPETSIERPGDLGIRAHTNHLIAGITPDPNSVSPMLNAPYLTPALVKTAYKLPSTGGSNAIAIVDAYDYPSSLNDFNFFSKQFGLPKEPSTNSTAASNATFQVVYASGSKPPVDTGWSQEAALDIEWAHAMAPNAKVYLVEAASSNFNDIIAAVNRAKTLPNVKEVSMSFGGGEAPSLFSAFDSAFLQQGVVFFASGGDSGGARLFPAESANVVAVGGTSLHLDMSGNRVAAESAWGGTGCGPSNYEGRPSFQNGVSSVVGSKRGSDDIAAVADPSTPVLVYDSTPANGMAGWLAFGGTSVAAPLIAGVTNLAGTFRASSQAQNQVFYSNIGSTKFTDIVSGSAGSFAAKAGYDLPTGVGTPLGLTGF